MLTELENRIAKLEKENKILMNALISLVNHEGIPDLGELTTGEEFEYIEKEYGLE